ncbi:hypothetical protein HY932_02175 [Candidatus Falkowbacteria bacterium]|nr:hypothetical protein [Candidatus Falkowbacteria bacterium]
MDKKIIFAVIICISLMSIGTFVFAGPKTATGILGEMSANLGDEGMQKGLEAPSGNLTEIVGKIIKAALSLLFVILVILIIYAGYLWMTAGGDPKQTEKARDYIQNAIIGLIIIVLAYAITQFVIDKLSGIAADTTK